jgi:hypothetical protein
MEITTQLLINYAHGLLTPTLAQEVKSAIEQDPFLQETYEGILISMKNFPDKDPEEFLDLLPQNIDRRKPLAFKLNKKLFYIAASILLFLCVGILYSYFNSSISNSPKKLAMTEIKTPFTDSFTTRGEENIAPYILQYNQRNYNQIIATLSSKHDMNAEEEFYLSLAYLQQEQAPFLHAETHLKSCIQLQSLGYTEAANYYLGLLYLAQQKNEQAEACLQLARGPYAERADLFLRKLK